MKDMEKENSIESKGEIVLYQPDASITMEVRLDATFDTYGSIASRWQNCLSVM